MPDHKSHCPGIYHLITPANAGAVVVDSPHSGRIYPDDFDFTCDFDDLRRGEDLLLDELLHDLPTLGAPVLLAEFPRTYIDVNRSVTDIDDALLDRPWPGPVDHTGRSYAGIGLIRRLLRPDVPVYDRTLSVDEIRHRIGTYYTPYHTALKDMIDTAHMRHGIVLHLNLHSMSHRVFGEHPATRLATEKDIVIGDRDSTTAARDLTRRVGELFANRGYRVGYNDPYKGAELIKRHGHPHQGRHSIQIEINKALYVFEKSLVLKPAAKKLRADLGNIITQLQADLDERFQQLAAD